MKILCEHCHKPITKEVIVQLGHYRIGHVLCPHCHKNSRRYLSELDILLYYSFSAILYAAALMITITLMNLYGSTIPVIAFTLFLVICMFLIMNYIAAQIYLKAWLKSDWKNNSFNENAAKIAKKGKAEFWIIMLVAFIFATQHHLLAFYPAVILTIAIILLIQIIFLYGNEKEEVEK